MSIQYTVLVCSTKNKIVSVSFTCSLIFSSVYINASVHLLLNLLSSFSTLFNSSFLDLNNFCNFCILLCKFSVIIYELFILIYYI